MSEPRVLVANRGEIAVRVLRTCREMGIPTIAVYSEVDRNALHVEMADEAYRDRPGHAVAVLPERRGAARGSPQGTRHADPPGVRVPRGERRLRAGGGGRRPDVHRAAARGHDDDGRQVGSPPGRGADRCAGGARDARPRRRGTGREGRPNGSGSRWRSRRRSAAGARACAWCTTRAGSATRSSAAPARRRPTSAGPRCTWSGTSRCAHHVEAQILADAHGNVSFLGERDCSLQRRYQKLVEETPSPVVDEDAPEPDRRGGARHRQGGRLRATPGRWSSWSNGDGSFYFMEVNARLQVEHPVTEMVTGLDLVRAPDPGGARRAGRGVAVAAGARHRVPAERRGPVPRLPARPRPRSPRSGRRAGRSSGGRRRSRGQGDPRRLRLAVRQAGRVGRGPRAGPAADAPGARRVRRARAIPTTIPFHQWVLDTEEFRKGTAPHAVRRGGARRARRCRSSSGLTSATPSAGGRAAARRP